MQALVRPFAGMASVVCLVLALLPVAPAEATSGEALCFAGKTVQCISGRFLDYWRAHGGLPVFGYPITPVRSEANRDTGRSYQTQWFERARFEFHPDKAAPYDVLLGRLGDDLLRQRGVDWRLLPGANGAPPANCRAFAPGRLSIFVCDQAPGLGFKTYWDNHGLDLGDPGVSDRESLALFGLPLTMPQMETNASGDRVLTQWFERARFEWHPGKPDQFKVLLGLLGKEANPKAGDSGAACTARLRTGDKVAVARDPFCLVWRDDYADETGFRIVLHYLTGDETFTYRLPAGQTQFVIPTADAPQSARRPCDRSSFSITVYALRPGSETLVGGFALEAECRPSG